MKSPPPVAPPAAKAAAPAPKAPPPAPAAAASNSQDDIDSLLASLDEATPAAEIRPSPQPEAQSEADVFELTDDMALPEPAPAPSFRKVEPEDDVEFTEARGRAPAQQPVREPPAIEPAPMQQIISGTTMRAVESAFNSLANTVLSNNARTLEDLVKEMLRVVAPQRVAEVARAQGAELLDLKTTSESLVSAWRGGVLLSLALAALLQAAQIGLAGAAMNRDVGLDWNASPRDSQPQFSVLTGRLRRAVDNHFEGLILFTIAVLLVMVTDTDSLVTAVCAWLYLFARLLYVPAYAWGWSPWRSLIWAVGFLSTLVMIVASLLT